MLGAVGSGVTGAGANVGGGGDVGMLVVGNLFVVGDMVGKSVKSRKWVPAPCES
jgi:hypothetical protein